MFTQINFLPKKINPFNEQHTSFHVNFPSFLYYTFIAIVLFIVK